MRKRVDVTADDIANGDQCQADHCPLAIAMTRALGRTVAVSVNRWRWWTEQPTSMKVYRKLPKSAIVFRSRFAQGYATKPFHFYVNIKEG